jgi:V8-like Glu-specific endopeptidase
MPITFSYRIVTGIAVAAVAVGVQALAGPAGAGGAGQLASTGQPAGASQPGGAAVTQDVTGTAARAAAVRYWTPARMTAVLRAGGGNGQPTAGRGGVMASPAGTAHPAGAPARRVRQLARKPPPARPGPRLTGDTAGRGLRWTRGGTVAAAVGKIFFSLGGEDYVCSGTLVGGKHPDVVLTAAHCVTSGAGQAREAGQARQAGQASGAGQQWATNWIFVPGFRDGRMPYGEYTAGRFFVIPAWTGPQGDGPSGEEDDVAFVQVTTATKYGAAPAAAPPPGLAVEFAGRAGQPPSRSAYVLGYPAEQPYAGEYLDYCAGAVTASAGSAATPCEMTAGDSGGPWLAGYSPRSGAGQVAAVSTYKLAGDPRVLYGAVLGPRARALYERAVSLAR